MAQKRLAHPQHTDGNSLLLLCPRGLTCYVAAAEDAAAAADRQEQMRASLQQAQDRLQAKRAQCDGLAEQLVLLEAAVAETQASFEAHLAKARPCLCTRCNALAE